jgi:glycosyltransferase involved in cell wall biosynthesis
MHDFEIVSIIIPCYKQAEYLPEALDSVLAQTYPHWECVVVNDASPDDTAAVAQSYADKDARIRVINLEKNGGLAHARNSGIAATNGKYIVPLDADDKLSKDYMEKSLSMLKQHPKVKVVYTDVTCFGIRNDVVPRPDFNLKDLCYSNLFQPTALYRRSDYLKTQGYRKNVFAYEDWDMWLQLIDSNDAAIRIPEPLFYIRVKEQSMITDLVNNTKLESTIRKQVHINNKERIEKWAPELLHPMQKSPLGRVKTAIKRLIAKINIF